MTDDADGKGDAEAIEIWRRRHLRTYLRDPAAIMAEAGRIAAHLTPALERGDEGRRLVARWIVRALASPELAEDLIFSEGAVEIGAAAIGGGAPIFVDSAMLAAGVSRSLVSQDRVHCRLYDADAAAAAAARGMTRSALAVERWGDRLEGAVAAIGQAPTALFRLLETLAEGGPRPAIILAFPVGFVGACEAKAALASSPLPIARIVLAGRRGGSAAAAAAINALATLARPAAGEASSSEAPRRGAFPEASPETSPEASLS